MWAIPLRASGFEGEWHGMHPVANAAFFMWRETVAG